MSNPAALAVRFNGHLCAAVPCGFSRKPVLLRARKGEAIFVVPIEDQGYDPGNGGPAISARDPRIANVACARAVKRTEECRRRILWMNLDQREEVQAIPGVARLLISGAEAKSRRGKRWKIVPLSAERLAELFTAPEHRGPQRQQQLEIT